jgi:hypothetical protein
MAAPPLPPPLPLPLLLLLLLLLSVKIQRSTSRFPCSLMRALRDNTPR